MGLFGNIKGQRSTKGGVYFKPGLYNIEVNRVKLGKTRGGDDFFVVETNVLESTNDDRPAGSSCSWMVMFKHDAALGNIADFLRAGLYANAVQTDSDLPDGIESFEEIEIDDEDADHACSEDNPLAGTLLRVEATDITTKKGNPFTVCRWSPPE